MYAVSLAVLVFQRRVSMRRIAFVFASPPPGQRCLVLASPYCRTYPDAHTRRKSGRVQERQRAVEPVPEARVTTRPPQFDRRCVR